MTRAPPGPIRSDSHFPYTTLFRASRGRRRAARRHAARADERVVRGESRVGGVSRARPGVAAGDGAAVSRPGRAGGAWHGEPGAGRGSDDAGVVADQHWRSVRCTAGARSLTPAAADAGSRAWSERARSAATTPA